MRWTLFCARLGLTGAALVAVLATPLYGAVLADGHQTEVGVPQSQTDGGAPRESDPAGTGGHDEGVRVHGDWVIEVRDPDGTLVDRREFTNALTGNGPTFFSRILFRSASPGSWLLNVSGSSPGQNPCVDASNNAVPCIVVEQQSPALVGPNTFKTLGVNLQTPTGQSSRLLLLGTATARKTGDVGRVGAQLNLCEPPVAGQSFTCPGTGGEVTSTTLATAVPVSINQTIEISVTISFS